jgi:hypothetical protein
MVEPGLVCVCIMESVCVWGEDVCVCVCVCVCVYPVSLRGLPNSPFSAIGLEVHMVLCSAEKREMESVREPLLSVACNWT